MEAFNPYRPPTPQPEQAPMASVDQVRASRRTLPRSFWQAWWALVSISFVGLLTSLSATLLDARALAFIGWPVIGLFVAPFVLARAKWCERYQHRCLTSGGLTIFFACFGVCFGLGYACLGIAVMVYMSFISLATSQIMGIVVLIVSILAASAVYLKLIELSAQRPRIQPEFERDG